MGLGSGLCCFSCVINNVLITSSMSKFAIKCLSEGVDGRVWERLKSSFSTIVLIIL